MFRQFAAAVIMLSELKFAVRRQRIFVFNFTYPKILLNRKFSALSFRLCLTLSSRHISSVLLPAVPLIFMLLDTLSDVTVIIVLSFCHTTSSSLFIAHYVERYVGKSTAAGTYL